MTANFSANGVTKSVRSVQNGLPWIMLSCILSGYSDNLTTYPRYSQIQPSDVSEENGVLILRVSDITVGRSTYLNWFTFYSDNSNNFTLDLGDVSYNFYKNGNIHSIKLENTDESNNFVTKFLFQLTNSTGAIIKFNSDTIIKILGKL